MHVKTIRFAAGIVACLVLTGLDVSPVYGQVDSEKKQEVLSLFDGETLDGWEITNFGAQGQVEVVDSTIVLNVGDPMTGITWQRDFPTSNYEVTVEAKRISGNDFFCAMTFPVKESFCTLVVGGWGGGVVGLSSIDGYDASENETRLYRRFETDRWYDIRLRVTDDSIQAWIDGEQVVDFLIEDHELSIRVEVALSRPFGFATWQTTGALRDVKLRLLGE